MIGIGVFKSDVDFGFVDFDDGADKLFEAVKDSFAQVVSNSGGIAFAGESAVDDGDGNAPIAFVEEGDADAENGIVEFVKRVGVVEVVGVGDTINGDDIAEFFVLLLFENFALFAVDNHASIFLLFEVVDDFAKLEIGNDSLSYGVDLKVFFFCVVHVEHSFTEGALSVTI